MSLLKSLQQFRDQLLGRGHAASTVPVMDGPFKPNHVLDSASPVYQGTQLGDIAVDGDQVWIADGSSVLRLDANAEHPQAQAVHRLDRPVTALCVVPGGIAVALDGPHDGKIWTEAGGRAFLCVNALSLDGASLLVTEGSSVHGGEQWQRDLMTLQRSGRICRIALDAAKREGNSGAGAATVLADQLGWPFGVIRHNGTVWFSESWRHKVHALRENGATTQVLHDLPGYPSRLSRTADGGFWLTLFACRTQLVEFVLREPLFRKRMIETIAPQLWAAPQFSSGHTFLEPLQGGAIKQMGILKPWAPPRSYGLVVRLDMNGQPLYSLHSRAGGRYHGIVAAAESARRLWLVSRGSNQLLTLDLAKVHQEEYQ